MFSKSAFLHFVRSRFLGSSGYGLGQGGKSALFFCLVSMAIWSCAEPRMPSGGPPDRQAPRLDSLRYSTPNRQTNFKQKEIILTFDEWVQLRDVPKQVLISPPMSPFPKIRLRYKSVVVRLPDTLRENTTYTIQFGNAISDITENNAASDMRFVFSTGAQLDSLKMQGQIVDALSGQAKENVWVMLYENLADSTPITERPYYCAKTNRSGQFELEHLRAGTYRIFALDDKNNNYLYDQANEAIGFLKEPYALTDSTQPSVLLRMFQPEPGLRVQGAKAAFAGCMTLRLSRKLRAPLRLEPLNLPADYTARLEYGMDTARLWFRSADLQEDSSYAWLVYEGEERLSDTVRLTYKKTPSVPAWAELELDRVNKSAAGKGSKSGSSAKITFLTRHPHKPLQLIWNRPLEALDTALCRLLDDSTGRQLPATFALDDQAPAGRLRIDKDTTLRGMVQVLFLPGALTDFYGTGNTDSLRLRYKLPEPEAFGNITAKVLGADSSMRYILQLLGTGEEVLEEHTFGPDLGEWEYAFVGLPPQSYQLRLVHDANANGRWDAGDYLRGEQPETITAGKSISLRANWDNETELVVDENKLKSKPAGDKKKF